MCTSVLMPYPRFACCQYTGSNGVHTRENAARKTQCLGYCAVHAFWILDSRVDKSLHSLKLDLIWQSLLPDLISMDVAVLA